MPITFRVPVLVAVTAAAMVAGCGGPMVGSPSDAQSDPPSVKPLLTASAAPPSASASEGPSPSLDTTAWVEYVSARYGLSIRHPADWTVRPSTHLWTLEHDSSWDNTATESFIAPGAQIRISAWSVGVKKGTSVEAWIEAYCRLNTEPCEGIRDRALPVYAERRDRHPGLLVPFAGDVQAFFLNDDRIYVVASWRPEGEFDSRRLVEAFALSMCLGCGSTPAAS
jgi:hypothetical protein